MEYTLVENDRGKQEPRKLGLAPVQRDDTEYEFDIVLDIARNHNAIASKDTTFLDKYGAVITPELGKKLKAWLDEGAEPPAPIVCSSCGKRIEPQIRKGKLVDALTIAEGTGGLCVNCWRTAQSVTA
jgi:hypothetical protein